VVVVVVVVVVGGGGWLQGQQAGIRNQNQNDQLRDQRSQGPRYWPPFDPWVQGELGCWAGLGVLRGVQLGPRPPGPGRLGSVAGEHLDRHRGWLFCPSPVPAAAGWGMRPRVFSAHGPPPQL
jgi:hypothetical protein